MAVLVEGHLGNIPMKFGWNRPGVCWGGGGGGRLAFWDLLWWPSCLSEQKDSSFFGREPPGQHSYGV